MIQELVWTIIGRLLFILFLLICIPLFIVFMLLPQRVLLRSNLFFTFEHIFHATVLMLSRLSITYKGQENISAEPAIFVSNHQSSFDIPLVGYCMKGHPHVWLSLAELKNSFLLRFVLPKIAILVDMTNPMSGVKTLRQATELLTTTPVHVIIFPEGGRFIDGAIHPFFGGFAHIARKTNRPVIPLYIQGINKVYPPGSFLIRNYPITVTIGKPLRMQTDESEDVFKERVYQWFVQQQEVQ